MSSRYTPEEYANMHLIYGECLCDANAAATLYRERYPNAEHHPDHEMFVNVHLSLSEGRFPGQTENGRKRVTEESNSDIDSGLEGKDPPPKKFKVDADQKSKVDIVKKTESDTGNGEKQWILEGLRMAKINVFRGRKLLDIREHYESNGKMLPGKKGISLSPYQWRVLLEHADKITKALN